VPTACGSISPSCPNYVLKSVAHSVIVSGDSLKSLYVDSVSVTPNYFVPDSTTIAYMEMVARNRDTFPDFQDTDVALAKEGVLRVLWDNLSLTSSSYPILHNFNDSISSKPMGEIMAIDSTIPHITTSSGFSTLLSSLEAITPNNNIEANLQTAAEGYLNFIINDTLTSTQLSTIRTLANKCPSWDGDAVYQARALMAIYDSAGTVYSDSCSSGGHHPGKRESDATPISIIQNATFNLYPNPNNGGFTLQYQLQQGESGVFTMYDMLGKKVAAYPLDSKEEKMNINESSLGNGVYLYGITVNGSIVKEDKVVIIK